MFKVDLSKTDFTTRKFFNDTVDKAEAELETRRKEIEEFKVMGEERLKQIEEWIEKREIKFTGYIYKTGKKGKRAVILMLFPDDSRRSYSRDSEKVDELREWVKQVQKEFSECDWSGFDYKLR